eukprot:SAG22_NODE_764_length_7397_cov_6.955604_13_plen_60_part_00
MHCQAKLVTFDVNVSTELRVLGRDFEWEPASGTFTVMVGGSSAGAGGGQRAKPVTFEVQ